jgi:outer membrane protein OmpA-like peptidoglycan-associated protein
LDVAFPLGGGVPNEGYITKVNKLVEILKSNGALNINIIGHSCDIGAEHIKRVIADIRAVYISRYFVLKGIDPGRIKTRGVCDFQPKVIGNSEKARSANRRVEFILE